MSALPAKHVSASRLAWKVARALAGRGWLLTTLHVSRRWRLRAGASSWIAQAYVSFFFDDPKRRAHGVVYAIDFEGKGSIRSFERSAVFDNLRRTLGAEYDYRRGRFVFGTHGETRPRIILAEMDRIARALGSEDAHRVRASRARHANASLWTIGETVFAHGQWSLETPGMRLPYEAGLWASISPMPASVHGRPEITSLLCIDDGRKKKNASALIARAEARGYAEPVGRKHPDVVLMKLEPLWSRAALAEARFLEEERARFDADS